MKKIENIFKYCSIDTGYLILPDNQIKLSTPNAFNDPYDTNLILNDKKVKKAYKLIFDYFISEGLRKIIFEKTPEVNNGLKLLLALAKYNYKLRDAINYRKETYKAPLKFSSLLQWISKSNLNKTLIGDKSKDALVLFINLINDTNKADELKRLVEFSSKKLLISCFSKNPNSILMWSHYAQNGRGLCLEFENEGFLDVTYSKTRKPVNIDHLMGKVLWQYNKQLNGLHESKDDPQTLAAIIPYLTKAKDWQYEAEVRVIFSNTNPSVFFNGDAYYFNMKKLVSITAGYRVGQEDLIKLASIAESKKVKFYKMELNDKTYGLVRKKLYG